MAEHFGIKVILVGGNAHEQVQEALERGEAVYLNVDVSLRPERSPQMPLLGATLPMDPAPALLALIQGVPVFWASCFHRPDQKMAVTLKREPSFGHEGELSTRDEVLTHWAGRLSEDLTAHPGQWWPLSFLILEEGAKQTATSSN